MDSTFGTVCQRVFSEFKGFVEVHDSDLLKAIQDYLPADEDWSDLELALADIDVDSIVQDHEHLMMPYGAEDWSDSGHHDFQHEVESHRRNSVERAQVSTWTVAKTSAGSDTFDGRSAPAQYRSDSSLSNLQLHLDPGAAIPRP